MLHLLPYAYVLLLGKYCFPFCCNWFCCSCCFCSSYCFCCFSNLLLFVVSSFSSSFSFCSYLLFLFFYVMVSVEFLYIVFLLYCFCWCCFLVLLLFPLVLLLLLLFLLIFYSDFVFFYLVRFVVLVVAFRVSVQLLPVHTDISLKSFKPYHLSGGDIFTHTHTKPSLWNISILVCGRQEEVFWAVLNAASQTPYINHRRL